MSANIFEQAATLPFPRKEQPPVCQLDILYKVLMPMSTKPDSSSGQFTTLDVYGAWDGNSFNCDYVKIGDDSIYDKDFLAGVNEEMNRLRNRREI